MESQAAKRRNEGKDHIILQLCKKHAALNMETRVRRIGKYNEDKVKEITNQIWAYIQAGSIELLDTVRETLLRSLYLEERTYLEKNWIPKETQFCRVYTSMYPNLGAYTI